jgi:hypothetical protein
MTHTPNTRVAPTGAVDAQLTAIGEAIAAACQAIAALPTPAQRRAAMPALTGLVGQQIGLRVERARIISEFFYGPRA